MINKKVHMALATIGISLIITFFLASYNFPHNVSKKYEAYNIVPEYDRQLKKVVISLDRKNSSLRLHSEFLSRLPEYTEILVLLPDSSIKAIMDEIKNQPYREKIKLYGFDTENLKNANVYLLFPEKDKFISGSPVDIIMPQGSLWAQDLFEAAVGPDGKTTLLISDLHKWFISNSSKDPYKVVSDNAFIGSLLSADMNVKRLPATFKGGNILIDVHDGKRIAFSGGDVLRQTKTVWKSTRDKTPSDDEIIDMLKRHLNVDDVIVPGKEEKQPSLMFHLDQAMTIFPGNVALITKVVQNENENINNSDEIMDVKRYLSVLRTTLGSYGYRVVDMYTSAHNVLNYQYYVNGIPFVNAETGQRAFYMPVFEDSQSQFSKANIEKNIAAIEDLGYRVIQVPTNAYKIHGGIHCLFNVIT